MALTQVDQGLLSSTAQYTGFKNRIINGQMQIAQRATAATNVTLNGPGYTTVDRFFSYQNTSVGVQTSQTASGLSGFQYALKWGRPVSNTTTGVTVIGQVVETVNSIDLQGQAVTFSFWAKAGANFSAASSQILVQVYTGTGTDQSATLMVTGAWTGSATPINTTATLTTSWQQFTFTGTFGASVTQAGVYIRWTPVGTAGADDNVYITGVQLEKGSVATSFDYRPYGTELALCQRYFEKSYDIGTVAGTSTLVGSFAGGLFGPAGGANPVVTVFYKVSKRTAVSPTIYATDGTAGKLANVTNAVGSQTTANLQNAGENSFVMSNSAVACNVIAGHYTVSAEL